jgi:hypothetical protein
MTIKVLNSYTHSHKQDNYFFFKGSVMVNEYLVWQLELGKICQAMCTDSLILGHPLRSAVFG